MTMRNPLDGERHLAPVRLEIDPAKRYRYTWPGSPPVVVAGAELATILVGANPALLAIEEVTGDAEPKPRVKVQP